jgi:dihydrofolate reductase
VKEIWGERVVMIVSIIVAMDRNRVIGAGGGLPWRLPADLARFKKTTMGKPVIMGRRTFESIGRPLPGRKNIVLSRRAGYEAAGCLVVGSLDEALQAAAPCEEAMIIGGADLYREALPWADRMYLTLLDHEFAGEVRFPPFDRAEWAETARETHPADAQNPFACTCLILERNREPGRA